MSSNEGSIFFFFLNQPNLLKLAGVRHTKQAQRENYKVPEIYGTPTHNTSRIHKEPKPNKIKRATNLPTSKILSMKYCYVAEPTQNN